MPITSKQRLPQVSPVSVQDQQLLQSLVCTNAPQAALAILLFWRTRGFNSGIQHPELMCNQQTSPSDSRYGCSQGEWRHNRTLILLPCAGRSLKSGTIDRMSEVEVSVGNARDNDCLTITVRQWTVRWRPSDPTHRNSFIHPP